MIVGTFGWIPIEENGRSVPFESERMSAFAYVHPDREGAVFVRDVPASGTTGDVRVTWVEGYPIPDTRVGDVITLIAGQRPIATISVTNVDAPAGS